MLRPEIPETQLGEFGTITRPKADFGKGVSRIVDQSSNTSSQAGVNNARILCVNPLIGFVDNFASAELINQINVDLAEIELVQASITGSAGAKVDERRKANCYKIPHGTLPSVEQITEKVSGLFRLRKELCEYPEYIAYTEGGVFQRHFDAALNGSMAGRDAATKERSQRVFTAILYLNDDFSGGTTKFPRLEIELQPQAGRLAFWQNTKVGGLGVHPFSMHEGRPVTQGGKQIVSFWFRDRPWEPIGDQ